MLVRLTAQAQIPEFVRACGYEHVFGSRALTALRAYGLEDDRARFYLCKDQNGPAAALYERESHTWKESIGYFREQPVLINTYTVF